jgi:hypothetical protein
VDTDVRRVIHVLITSANDFQDAQIWLNKLDLKKLQEVEILKAIMHCLDLERSYNLHYTALARKVCPGDMTRTSSMFTLDICKSLGN